MKTQIQATPTLYGKDAKVILDEVNRKPSKEQRMELRNKYRNMFKGIKFK